MPLGPQIATLVNVAADRLEELQRERDDARAEVERLSKELEDSTNHYNRIHDVLRAEVERLKQELHDARIENSGQAAQLERTRPDPSRLEIAAMLLVHGWADRSVEQDAKLTGWALAAADALIAAAREAK